MKKLRFFFFMVFLALAWVSLAQTSVEVSLPPVPTLPLGEKLTYKITWLKIPVGAADISVLEKTTLNNRPVFHVVGRVNTNRVLSKIYPTHDEIHSWIDAETLEALQFEKKISQLLVNTHEKMIFDGAKKKGYFESYKTGKKNEYAISSPVHDFMSVFYWIRRHTLAPGDSVKTVLTCDQKEWTLIVNIRGRETIKHHGAPMETLRVEPITVVDGIEKRNRVWVNITDDALHQPVRIVYKAPFGSVVGTLKKSE